MKNNKRLGVGMIAVLLIAIVGLAVFAAQSQTDKQDGTPDAAEPVISAQKTEDGYTATEHLTRENAVQSRIFEDENGTRTLTYRESQQNGSKTVDLYTDQTGGTYLYSEDGTLVSCNMNNSDQRTEHQLAEGAAVTAITEEQAVEIAAAYGKEHYGTAFDLVEFDSVSYDDAASAEMYTVSFKQKLGDQGFITGMTYSAMIWANGSVYSSGMTGYEDLADFDSRRLDSLTYDAIYADLESKTRQAHPDNLVDFEISTAQLLKQDDNYVVRIGVMSHILLNGMEVADGGIVYDYPVPEV